MGFFPCNLFQRSKNCRNISSVPSAAEVLALIIVHFISRRQVLTYMNRNSLGSHPWEKMFCFCFLDLVAHLLLFCFFQCLKVPLMWRQIYKSNVCIAQVYFKNITVFFSRKTVSQSKNIFALIDGELSQLDASLCWALCRLASFVSAPAWNWQDVGRYLTWPMPKYLQYSNRQAGRMTAQGQCWKEESLFQYVKKTQIFVFVAHIFIFFPNYHPVLIL